MNPAMPASAPRARSTAAPADLYKPQLATLVKSVPDGDEWLHEVKFDGYRIGIVRQGRSVWLITRNGNDWTDRYPGIVSAVQRLDIRDAVIDGELTMVLPDGRTSFQALQNLGTSGGTLTYFAFDLLALNGRELASKPLEARKEALRAVITSSSPPIRYSEHVVGNGPRVFAEACAAGLEGIVSKRRDAPAHPGRTKDWVKTKCALRQEFVIGGFTEPQGSRVGIGALLVGYNENGRLVWAGKVGTGFNERTARDLRQRLERIRQPASPFSPPPRGQLGKEARWVRPSLVGEVTFTEWTDAGKIRHPSFQGLRADKPATEVIRERPSTAGPTNPPAKSTRARAQTNAASEAVVAGVRITNPDRVIYPDSGITKLELARYYETVSDWMLPHVKGRPLTLLFCPDGLAGECRFLKHGKSWGPKALRRVNIREKTKTGEYMVIESVQGLVSLIQMNWLEAHTWNSTIDHLEQPDRLVLDLDPGPRVTWAQVVAAAREVRQALQSLKLRSWVKTTGGRGLHVLAPLKPERDWSECLAFARGFAEMLAAQFPARYTTEFSKQGREDRILIDYLRNNRTNTSIAAFSPRARPGAPVSTPLDWSELSTHVEPSAFTVRTVPDRLRQLPSDPWAGYFRSRQRLTDRMLEAVSYPGQEKMKASGPVPKARKATSRTHTGKK